ncbi:uncharacterized protein LOC135839840 isoform X2 [Planococcus citri]|uniref:uncharacterized protein LOC135839840 isoform X2 n=1 Tax=Planococcus citri TaxID=170843 RepID=UPI0031FA1605
MKTASSLLVSQLNQKYTKGPFSDEMIRKKKRKRPWWREKIQSTAFFTIILFIAFDLTSASSHDDDRNGWLSANNVFTYHNGINNEIDVPRTDIDEKGVVGGGGGTPWASASEEAFDERRDAEIFRAVVYSIADWKERQRIRHAKEQNHGKLRKKRSQDDSKSNSSEKEKKLDDETAEKEPLKVCYDELGCFQEAGYIDLLPNSPEEVNTRYLLYNSRRSRGDTPLLDVSAQNISSIWEWAGKAFNVSAPTKVIIHGFGSSCSNVWVYEMRSALMSVEECNIICVDWEAGATIPNYVRAAANTRLVGKQVAILLSGLEKYVNLSVRNVHVIGFSLGAHVAGFAGSELKNLSRITGLDPAGPLFESQDRRARLDSMDAQFVDVIHSNGENLILGGLGAWQPMGHVDFYPNGGRMQKGCTNLFVGAVSDMIWSANEVYGRSLCNHRRAYKFFTDSVSPKCQFPAVPCESYDHFIEGKCFPCQNLKDCNNMGYYADKFSGRGTLYLLTRDEEPFCANQYMVKVENSPDKDPSSVEKSVTFGKIQITLIGDLELNETFVITQKKDEKLISGDSVSRIIVPHPALQNFLEIQVLYVAYNGWLSSGTSKWRINKISLTNSYGHVLSACREDLVLETGVPVILELVPRNCNIHEINQTFTSVEMNNAGFANEFHRNKSYENTYPRTQVVRIGNEILTNRNHSGSSNIDNVTKIGIGVTEYINDPWKQKGDLAEVPSNLHNHLDDTKFDNGGARHLKYINAVDVEKSSNQSLDISSTSSVASEADSSTSRKKDSNPYEFVTEQLSAAAAASGTVVVLDSEAAKLESEITEPVLKPRASGTLRTRKSQHTHRPQYGKSMNVVNPNWRSTSTTYAKALANTIFLSPTTMSSHYQNSTVATGSGSAVTGSPSDIVNAAGGIRSTKNTEEKPRKYEDGKNSSSLFVVQFLPQKLISFFEQAERYARMAFLPFITPSERDGAKSTTERSRRIRTFSTNRWTNVASKETSNERRDLNVDETRNVAPIVVAAPAKTSDFPYAFHQSRSQLWQQMSYEDSERKYIPLTEPKTTFEAEQLTSNTRSEDDPK